MSVGQVQATNRGSKGREETVFNEYVRIGKAIEERRLAGVRVPHDGGHGEARTLPRLGSGIPRPARLLQLPFDLGHPFEDPTTVGLEFRLAWTTSPDAGAETGEFDSLATQAGEAVAVLSEFDLETALVGMGVLGEDIEDQGDTIHDVALERLVEIALLGGREIVVEHDNVDVEHVRLCHQF